MEHPKFDLIFDNGGGTTLQTDGYVHYYDNPLQAAEDIKAIMSGSDPIMDGWEGNEIQDSPAAEYDYDTERNGGYRWFANEIPSNEESSWNNIDRFVSAYYGIDAV